MDPDGSLTWLDGLSRRGVRLGLGNMVELLGRLGDPHDGMRFVHVAGTDGKGSVCAMVESILRASGFRVGAFTSPFIMRVNECIRLDGEDVLDDDLSGVVSMVRPHVEDMEADGMECTYFEVLTAVALLYFRLVAAEIAVVEVGMGGRLDSTNVVVPEVSVINDVSMEHRGHLGDTIQEIALQKAGIMKPGVPCVTSNDGPVLEVLMRHAEEIGSPLVQISAREVEVVDSKPDSVDMLYRGELYTVGLPGRHQAKNAALAIAAVSLLPDYVDRIVPHIAEGLEDVSWPCRMQKVMGMPLVVDATHTVSGAECLRRDVEEIYGRVVLVLAMLDDKDLDGVSGILAPMADTVFVTQPDSPRAATAEALAEVMSVYHGDVRVRGTVAEAVEDALEARGESMVLVTGSFRTAEDVLRWLQTRSA